jgi:hypothetical protein
LPTSNRTSALLLGQFLDAEGALMTSLRMEPLAGSLEDGVVWTAGAVQADPGRRAWGSMITVDEGAY